LVSIFENIIRTSHVNVMYELSSSFGVQMNFQAALWSRLGTLLFTHPADCLGNHNLSSAYTEIFLHNYGHNSQAEDVVRAHCIKAIQVQSIYDGH
jgi:hypothetical protein